MANATPSRFGQINSLGDATALFLKVFSGEVLTAFEEANVALALTQVRTIQSGKSAQFPTSWKASASYHTPGTELNGGQIIKHGEKIINIDNLLLADAFIANIDEAMNHYDVRGEYSKQLGRALAKKLDGNLLQLVVLAARAASNFDGGDGFGGTQLTNAAYDTTADTLVQGIMDAAQTLDEKDVPEADRVCVVRPKHYNMLVQSSKAVNRDYTTGNGDFARRKVFMIGDIRIVKSNHLPSSIVAAATGENNTYSGDFTNTVAAIFHKSAVATVKLMDLAMESEYQIQRQGTLFVAKYAMGHGILRPEAAVELKKA